jgi:hypothetical protein
VTKTWQAIASNRAHIHMASDDEKPARFGCLDAARWAVAAAVTAAILVVIAYAVQAVLRPGELTLSIAGGHVSVDRKTSTPDIRLM